LFKDLILQRGKLFGQWLFFEQFWRVGASERQGS
jgi:hypothetical protein